MANMFAAIQDIDQSAIRIIVAMAFTFAAVFLFVYGLSTYVRARTEVRRRAILARAVSSPEIAAGQEWFANTRSLRYQSLLAISALLGDVERSAARDDTETSKIRRELLRAGFFGKRSVFWYQFLRVFFFVAAGLAGYAGHAYLFPNADASSRLIAVAICAGVGFLLPSRFVASRKQRLLRQCREGFPDFIDLMIVCTEAGLGPRAAIDRLSREIAQAHPVLGAHLYLANLEIRAGNSLHEALFNLSRRLQLEEAAALASLLEQTEQLGTSLTGALRVYSDEMRERRLVRAEEKAHALPAKLVLPLGLFVFPVILIVIMLPAIIRMKNAGF